MQRELAGARRISFGIGLGTGLIAGVVGIAQRALAAHDLAARWAVFLAARRSHPGFDDAAPALQGNQWYWLGTATAAGLMMLVLYLLTAFTVGWALGRRGDGSIAAWMAVAVSGTMYMAATFVALLTGPLEGVQGVIITVWPCQLPLGLAFFGMVLLVAPVCAGMGVRVRQLFSHGRVTL